MGILNWSKMSDGERSAALQRPGLQLDDVALKVTEIISTVRRDGDAALRRYSREFDGAEIEDTAVSREEIDASESLCERELLDAVDAAARRIEAFHRAGLPQDVQLETAQGLVCESRYIPLSPVGLYVPGGSAPLISTVLMLAIPARLANCGQIVLCTPPAANGRVDPAVLAAASRCGISQVFRVGGAQAIAAMAWGTESIPRCVKLFGPGNAWVTEAKRQAASTPDGAAQDLPAGPSEVLVIADSSADPVSTCWDLLSQAEHGPDSQAILISDSDELLQAVKTQIPALAADLPRAKILSQSLKSLRLIKVDQISTAINICNRYAPEHLIINCTGAEKLAREVTTAGSVFVGAFTPESLGDYCSGTNHVLPTYGYARAYSGLSAIDFMRRMTLQTASAQGLSIAGPVAAKMAAAEGLDAHRLAVEYRLSRLDASSPDESS